MAHTWIKKEVNKTLSRKTEPYTDEEGKTRRRTVPGSTVTQKVELEYPHLAPLTIRSVADLADALGAILSAAKPGFDKLAQLVEHVNFGLQNNAAGILRRGADLRYSQAQQNTIKQIGDLFLNGILDRDVAISALLKQGITDADAVLDAYAPDEDEDDDSVSGK